VTRAWIVYVPPTTQAQALQQIRQAMQLVAPAGQVELRAQSLGVGVDQRVKPIVTPRLRHLEPLPAEPEALNTARSAQSRATTPGKEMEEPVSNGGVLGGDDEEQVGGAATAAPSNNLSDDQLRDLARRRVHLAHLFGDDIADDLVAMETTGSGQGAVSAAAVAGAHEAAVATVARANSAEAARAERDKRAFRRWLKVHGRHQLDAASWSTRLLARQTLHHQQAQPQRRSQSQSSAMSQSQSQSHRHRHRRRHYREQQRKKKKRGGGALHAPINGKHQRKRKHPGRQRRAQPPSAASALLRKQREAVVRLLRSLDDSTLASSRPSLPMDTTSLPSLPTLPSHPHMPPTVDAATGAARHHHHHHHHHPVDEGSGSVGDVGALLPPSPSSGSAAERPSMLSFTADTTGLTLPSLTSLDADDLMVVGGRRSPGFDPLLPAPAATAASASNTHAKPSASASSSSSSLTSSFRATVNTSQLLDAADSFVLAPITEVSEGGFLTGRSNARTPSPRPLVAPTPTDDAATSAVAPALDASAEAGASASASAGPSAGVDGDDEDEGRPHGKGKGNGEKDDHDAHTAPRLGSPPHAPNVHHHPRDATTRSTPVAAVPLPTTTPLAQSSAPPQQGQHRRVLSMSAAPHGRLATRRGGVNSGRARRRVPPFQRLTLSPPPRSASRHTSAGASVGGGGGGGGGRFQAWGGGSVGDGAAEVEAEEEVEEGSVHVLPRWVIGLRQPRLEPLMKLTQPPRHHHRRTLTRQSRSAGSLLLAPTTSTSSSPWVLPNDGGGGGGGGCGDVMGGGGHSRSNLSARPFSGAIGSLDKASALRFLIASAEHDTSSDSDLEPDVALPVNGGAWSRDKRAHGDGGDGDGGDIPAVEVGGVVVMVVVVMLMSLALAPVLTSTALARARCRCYRHRCNRRCPRRRSASNTACSSGSWNGSRLASVCHPWPPQATQTHPTSRLPPRLSALRHCRCWKRQGIKCNPAPVLRPCACSCGHEEPVSTPLRRWLP